MSGELPDLFNLTCPTPQSHHPTIQLAHGGGGRLMRDLLERTIVPTLVGPPPSDGVESREVQTGAHSSSETIQDRLHDSAVFTLGDTRVAFTTDTFVISPLVFPGGDIGKLAVCGTVNDLAMAGARPQYLSCALVLEEGLRIDGLEQILASMRAAADEAGVAIVTGDTKVVDHGKGDGVYINTAGVGVVPSGVDIHARRVSPGDVLLLSGDVGRHALAVMSVREGLDFETELTSDCAPLGGVVAALVDRLGLRVRFLRDLTRGGLAAAVNELAVQADVGIAIEEASVPVSEPVAAACEMLGLDPFYAANEGRFLAVVPEDAVDEALAVLEEHPAAPQPARIGRAVDEHRGVVELRTPLGSGRILDLLSGEQMPRIC